jgi:hypothetical protein
MADLIFHPADRALAERIQADLARRGAEAQDRATIVLLSPSAAADPAIQQAITRAVDQERHIVPVLAAMTGLPGLIEHLEPLDFSTGYDLEALAARLNAEPSEMNLKVRTPQVMAANRRLGAIITLLAILMFVAALYAVGVLGIQAPREEYDAVETEVAATRSAIIEQALPRSTEDALNFEATLEQAAPSAQPALAATASAIARP